jgi:hypothetical protein
MPTSTRFSTSMTKPSSVTPSITGIPLQTGFSSTLTATTHDDGKWHTSYPSWNGTVLRRGSRNGLRSRQAV